MFMETNNKDDFDEIPKFNCPKLYDEDIPDTAVSIGNDNDNMLTLTAAVCGTVLKKAIKHLAVLSKLDVEDEVNFAPLEPKFGTHASELDKFDFNTIQQDQKARPDENFNHVQIVRSFVAKLFEKAVKSLNEKKHVSKFSDLINLYKNDLEEEEILKTYEKCKMEINTLNDLLKSEYEEFVTNLQLFSEEIGCLKDKIKHNFEENEIKYNYITKWENSRIAQNNMVLKNRENKYVDNIAKIKNDVDKEMRVTAEVEKFITKSELEHLRQIEHWTERYNKDINIKNTEIEEFKKKRDNQLSEMRILIHVYDEHRTEIDEYLKLKEKRRQEAEQFQLKLKCVIKIQAWWRGVMVRRQLGPFKIKKERKTNVSGKKKKSS